MSRTTKVKDKSGGGSRQLSLLGEELVVDKKPATSKGRASDKTAHSKNRSKKSPSRADEVTDALPLMPIQSEDEAADLEYKVAQKKAAKSEKGSRRATAEMMASKQREISVSEFFTKNRHLLGFDNPGKALLTTVKEAVDNSLDACEEAGIAPSIRVEIHQIEENRFRVVEEDNGPGIVKQQIPKVFGKLLYGSKFHRLKQSRGQQGIGISAAGMYGQLTTGRPVVITSRTNPRFPAHQFEIVLDTRKNTPEVVGERDVEDWHVEHGTRVEIELEGIYKGGRRSVDEYLELVAIANPHAELIYAPPNGKPPLHLPRATEELPLEANEIKPHPHGVEFGNLLKMLKETKASTVSGALQRDFSRVTSRVAEEICEKAGVEHNLTIRKLTHADIERLYKAISHVKIMAPQTNCVVPIGEDLIRRGLEREIKADLYASCTRPPAVYRGNPFRVEVGLAYGGSLRTREDDDDDLLEGKATDKAEGPITLLRFANRVPLQYQPGACAIFKAVTETNWKQYGMSQPRGGLPLGPMVLLVHLASVWVPFTSESKEAIANYPEIIKEIKLALRECARQLSLFLRRRERARDEARRRSIFELYIGELAASLTNLTGTNPERLQNRLLTMAKRHTEVNGVALEAGIEPTIIVEGEEGLELNGNGNSQSLNEDGEIFSSKAMAGKGQAKGAKKGKNGQSEKLSKKKTAAKNKRGSSNSSSAQA